MSEESVSSGGRGPRRPPQPRNPLGPKAGRGLVLATSNPGLRHAPQTPATRREIPHREETIGRATPATGPNTVGTSIPIEIAHPGKKVC